MKGVHPQKADPAILSILLKLLQSQVENTLANISQGKSTTYSRALIGCSTAAAMRRIHYEGHDECPEMFINVATFKCSFGTSIRQPLPGPLPHAESNS